jgi:TetR/AcrR family transcriptional repressor of nem operon
MSSGAPELAAGLTRKGQATRDRIVRAAADLIFERGANAVSLLDVRRAVGVSGSQLSHYFGDKESLIRAVIALQADEVVRIHQIPEFERLDTFAALERWAAANVQRLKDNNCQGGCSFGSLAGELADGPNFRADLASGFDRWEQLFREGLTLMRDRGDLRADADPERLTFALLAALQGGMLLAKTARDPAPLEAALSSVLQYAHSYAT